MISRFCQDFLIKLLRLYKLLISPLFPAACRYHPSCSEYAIDAVSIHGITKGVWLTAKRLLRCQPWGGHGLDPVPPKNCAHKKPQT